MLETDVGVSRRRNTLRENAYTHIFMPIISIELHSIHSLV